MILDLAFVFGFIICFLILIYKRKEKYDDDDLSIKWHNKKYIDSNRIRRPIGLKNDE